MFQCVIETRTQGPFGLVNKVVLKAVLKDFENMVFVLFLLTPHLTEQGPPWSGNVFSRVCLAVSHSVHGKEIPTEALTI